jgi:alpha-ketoglutarate-dependent taurine dioxygenase
MQASPQTETVTQIETQSGLDVRPTSGHIGAEIHGVDLSRPLDDRHIAEIRAALLRWKVVFFRNQRLSQAEHVAFGRRFGKITPAHPTLPAAFPEHPEILLLDSKQANALGGTEIASLWHTDVTFVPNPPMGAILHGAVIPPFGGDTQWLNLAVAYERLSTPIKEMIDGLHAVHSNRINMKRGELSSEYEKRFRSQDLCAVHPVVRVHPETGEKVLFVNPNFTDHIVELSRQESRHLLAMLYEHMTDHEFTTRFHWEPGSIAFWDNRATAHIVPTDIPAGAHRAVQRITLAGDLPVGPDGERSYALKGDAFQ